MKKLWKTKAIIFFILVSSFLINSCSSTKAFNNTYSVSETGILVGSVTYENYFLPTRDDILDLSLLSIDSTTGEMSEISHQRIRNVNKFPVQFVLRYDKEDLSSADSCTLYVVFTSNSETLGRSFCSVNISEMDNKVEISLIWPSLN